MKKRILSFITLLILMLAIFSFTACTDKPKKDYKISDSVFSSFTAEDYDGNIIDETVFIDYKITMINVWGTFCNPCKTEAPELAELNNENIGKGIQVIGIPVDTTRNSAADAKEIIDEVNADYRHLKVSASIKPFVSSAEHLPYTIFVNAEGKQIGDAYSGAKSKADWKILIDKLLEFINNPN